MSNTFLRHLDMPAEVPSILMIENELETQNQPVEVMDVPALLLSNLNRPDQDTDDTDAPAAEIFTTEATTKQSNEGNKLTESNLTSSSLSNTIDAQSNNDDNTNVSATMMHLPTSTTTTTHAQRENDAVANAATANEQHNDNIHFSVLDSSQSIVNSQSLTESTSTFISSSTTVHPATEHSIPMTTSTTPPVAEIILGEIESISKSPEPDNYIYETFSSMPPVALPPVVSDTVATWPAPADVVSHTAAKWPTPAEVVSGNEPSPDALASDDSYTGIVAPTNDHLVKAEEPPEAIAVAVAA